MYKIEIPKTVYQLLETYYRLKIWSREDARTYGGQILKYFHFIWMILFLLSLAIGAYATSDKDESIFLVAVTLLYVNHFYRLTYIIWRKNGLLTLITHPLGRQYTEYQSLLLQNGNYKLNMFIKCVICYMITLCIGTLPLVFVIPIVSEKHLMLFNIAFPFDRSSTSKIGFWMAYAFVIGGVFEAIMCTLFISMGWYLMLHLSIEYKLLGSQFQHMGGMRPAPSDSKTEHLKLFEKDLSTTIESYERINGTAYELETFFGRLFLLQLFTCSLCLCGGVYALAFSSHADLGRDGYSCAFLAYSICDIIIIMYLGNEIKLSSDKLSQHLYESNWMSQTQICRKGVIIVGERLKQPQQLMIGKIYPLNLLTFTSLIKAAYSMFSVLISLRK